MNDGTQRKRRPRAGMPWRVLACAMLVLGSGAPQAGALPPDYGNRLVQGYIAPAMQEFQAAASRLQASLDDWCAAAQGRTREEASGGAPAAVPGAATQAAPASAAGAARIGAAFALTVRAWSGIEFLRFGPLVEANRHERIHFWPDPRGMVLRQVQGLLAKPDGSVPNAAQLATHSVAVQGLPALEYILYKEEGGLLTAAAPDGAYCEYAASIAGNLAGLGAELARAWGPGGDYARQFSQPSPDNALYRSRQEVAAEAIKALSTGLQFARDVKLLPVLGAGPGSIQYKRAPFWRSGLSVQSMEAALQGMAGFYRAGAYQYADDEAWIDASLRDELQRALDNFAAMEAAGGMEPSAQSGEGYRQLTLASLVLKNIKSIVDEHMAPAFGVRIGFNALDGD